MKTAAVAFLCLFALALSSSPAYALCVEVGKTVPDFRLPMLEGGTLSLSSLRGKIVLLAFWASWCPRCREELTFLQGVYQASPDITVVAVNQESQNISHAHVARIRASLSDWKIGFPVLLDRNLDAWNAFCINALPTSVILDKKGVVRFAEPNYYWASQEKIADVIAAIRQENKDGVVSASGLRP